jgi:hypothetical protein
MKKVIIILLYCNYVICSLDLSPKYMMKSPDAMLLSEAYLAKATDSYTLFYNPALMARNNGVSLTPLNLSAQASNVISQKDSFDKMPSSPVEFADKFLDFPLFANVGYAPGLKTFNFGFSFLFNVDVNALTTNAIAPTLDLDYKYDNGFACGFGAPIIKSGDQKVSLGASVKYVRRSGISESIPLISNRTLDAISGSKRPQDVLRALGSTSSTAWGVDVGADYWVKKTGVEYALSVSLLDAYLPFDPPDKTVFPLQTMSFNAGSFLKLGTDYLGVELSFDLSPLGQNLSLMQAARQGVQVNLPLIKLFAGHQFSGLSYGASFDFFIFRVIGGFYHAAIGSPEKYLTQDRAVISLNIFDFYLDGI